jgi:hypothetical protein
MKKSENPRGILLVFSSEAKPGHPVPLNKESLKKLGELPKAIKALLESYGTTMGEPTLWGGAVHLEFCDESDLFEIASSMVEVLEKTAQQLSSNAQRQPPLPLAQAASHAHGVELLHALAQAFEKSGLVATLCTGERAFELPHVPLAHFTEPEKQDDRRKRINQELEGLCKPRNGANGVLLENLTILELPLEHYPYEAGELVEKIFLSTTYFSGWARAVRKGVLRAEPGGDLVTQEIVLVA